MSDIPDDDVLNPRNTTSPHALSLGDPSLVAGNIADPVWQRWREEIAGIGGASPLLHFEDCAAHAHRAELDASGRAPAVHHRSSTLLSSLIRDELALRTARAAANAITAKGIELRSVRGIESMHLAIGLAAVAARRRGVHAPPSCCGPSRSAATAATSS